MAIIRLQGEAEKQQGIYYEFDSASTPLGEGGMGKVYRGRRINILTHETRDVAIKFMFAGLPPNVIQRAEDEANIKIHHDNLVEMMEFLAVETRMPNGMVSVRYHVVSELLIGVSLSDLIQGVVTDQSGAEIPYAKTLYKLYNTDPEQFAVTVVKKILAGIMALHDAGYIHRDIDPSNIMITRDGKIKLIDFGIAKKVDGLKTHDRNLTTAGQFMGKPQYAAPELIIGDLKNQNKPTDIYAVGVLLFQLIVGHLPFEGPSNVVLNCHMRSKMPLKLISNGNIRKIVEHATEKDCTKRYQSAAEFRVALDSYKQGSRGVNINLEDKKMLLGGLVAALIVVVVVILLTVFRSTQVEHDPYRDTVETDTSKVVLSPLEMSPLKKACNHLGSTDKAAEGLRELNALADGGDVEAMFILSRLYAVQVGAVTLSDEYVLMQANLKDTLSPDARKAHNILLEIKDKDPKYYKALYELACDYWEGSAAGAQRDLSLAKKLLNEAATLAKNAGDKVYENKINAMLQKY